MVLDGLFSNVLASVLMNGICCIHSMQEEEARRKEHREFLRKSIHVEWERQRIIERELLEKQLKEQGLSDAVVVAEARRRLLIAAKIQAKQQQSLSVTTLNSQSCRFDDREFSMPLESQQPASSASPKTITPPSAMNVNGRLRSAPVWCVRDAGISGSASVVSSLFDDDEEDEEDMEEIALR